MHKINVCFFASLREKLGVDKIEFELSGSLSILELKEKIAIQMTEGEMLLKPDVQASIDFEFARDNSQLDPEKVQEVAFFPPVTGG